ncbi:hypothetical protein [Nocardia sp. BMG51109]|uniref:hypothetical protein n=1 Tax=Nocardia sp. BMG51109 TaxID=1056816 RepID=UPI0004BAFDBB|nr:hypothetical protein [Nocardia sp. BMG51109]
MAERVEIDPSKLGLAGESMLSIKDKMAAIFAKLNDEVGSAGEETWGDDKFGKGFAEGEEGYIESRKQLLGGGGDMVKTIGEFGQGMIDGAAEIRNTDNAGF